MSEKEVKEIMLKQLQWAKDSQADASYMLATYHMILEVFPDMYTDFSKEMGDLLCI